MKIWNERGQSIILVLLFLMLFSLHLMHIQITYFKEVRFYQLEREVALRDWLLIEGVALIMNKLPLLTPAMEDQFVINEGKGTFKITQTPSDWVVVLNVETDSGLKKGASFSVAKDSFTIYKWKENNRHYHFP